MIPPAVTHAPVHTTVITVGAPTYWREGCAAPAPACADPARALRFADDDAWRAAFLLSSLADAGDVHVLTRPDASTFDRAFPGGPPGRPTSTALLDTVRDAAGAGPHRVVIYLAAHATAEEVFLDDGRFSFAELRQRIYALLGPDDELLLVSDACLSARWRSGTWGYSAGPVSRYPPVDKAPANVVEIAVDSLTPEDASVNGGMLSYLVLSGLVGAADDDGDGVVRAQELSDFVHSYTSAMATPIAPVVRAPRGLAGWPLPELSGARLRLDRAEPRRWIVRLPDGTALVEALTVGRAREIVVPPGSYEVLEVPVALDPDGGVWRTAGPTARRHTLTALAAGSHTSIPVDGADVPLATWRGADDDTEAPETSPLPGAGPHALPHDWARYHAPPAGRIDAGISLEAGTHFDDRLLSVVSARWTHGPLGIGWLGGGVGFQLDRERTLSPASTAQLGGGLEPSVLAGRWWEIGLLAGLEADLLTLPARDTTMAAPGAGIAFGPTFAVPGPLGWGVHAEAVWLPTLWLRAVDAADERPVDIELNRARVAVSVSWTP